MNLELLLGSVLLLAFSAAFGGNLPVEYSDRQCLDLPTSNIGYGEIDRSTWRSLTGLPDLKFMKNAQYLSVDTSLNGSPHLVQRLIPTQNGSHTVTGRSVISTSRTYFLTQSVYLEPGFEWGGSNEGGKLGFGLGGGSSPSGASRDTDGFTARFMWRGNGDGSAHIAVYSYASDRTQNYPYGDDYPLDEFRVPIGEWFDLSMEVTLNSATNRSDGSVRAWANGKQLLERDNIQWQSSGETPLIEFLSYATFYGGNDRSWSPSRPTYARFNNVCWSTLTPPEGEGEGEGEGDGDVPNPDTAGDDNRKILTDALSLIDQLLPINDGRINWRLNSAKTMLNEAIQPSGWMNISIPAHDSSIVATVRDAARKVVSARDATAANELQIAAINDIARLLSVAATNISVMALEDTKNLLTKEGCDQLTTSKCADARYDWQQAEAAIFSLHESTDVNTTTYHAEKAWKKMVKARAHLGY